MMMGQIAQGELTKTTPEVEKPGDTSAKPEVKAEETKGKPKADSKKSK